MLVDAHTHRASSHTAVRILTLAELRNRQSGSDPFAVGLHPWDLLQAQDSDKEHIRHWAHTPGCVAIGETGLDRVRSTPFDLQLSWLHWHWDLAEELQKPLVLHAVRSSSDLLQLFKRRRPRAAWLWHDFSGPETVIKSALKLHPELHFSFSPRGIARKDFQQLWEQIPSDRRLLETDDSGASIAELYQTVQPPEDVLERTFKRLFGLTVHKTQR